MAIARPVRWILVLVGGALALLVAAALLVPLFVDVQRFTPAITASLRDLTGREVTFGSTRFRLLPSPAVTVSPVTVAEGPRYPGRDAVRIQSLAIQVRFLPLLRGRIEFGSIVLERPVVTLIRDAQGRFSFDDVVTRARSRAPEGAAAAPREPGLQVGIAKAEIRDGKVLVYDDAVVPKKRTELALAPISATVSGWGLPGGAKFEMSAGLGESRLAATGSMTEPGRPAAIAVKVTESTLRAQDLALLFPWLGVARPEGLEVGGSIRMSGDAEVPLETGGPVPFHGTITVDDLRYKDAALRQPIEKIGGRLEVDGQRARWNDFTATLGGSTITGRLQIEDYLAPRIGFDLKADRLDLDQVFALVAPAGPAPGTRPAAGSPATGGAGAGAGTDTALRGITARGTLAAKALHFQGFDLGDVRAGASLRDGVFALDDLAAAICGGTLKGSASADLTRGAPAIRVEARLTDTDVDALATAYDKGLKGIVRGRLTGDLAVAAKGTAFDALLDTARGSMRLAITNGAVTSISILKTLAGLLEMAGGKGIGRDETPFDSLTGTFAIGGGKAVTDDLFLDSADLDLAGRGDIVLDASVDLAILATFSPESSSGMIAKTARLKSLADDQGRIAVNLKATGSLAAPKVTLDTSRQVQQFKSQQKEELKEKVRGRLLDLLGGKKPEEKPPSEPPPSTPPPADDGGGGR